MDNKDGIIQDIIYIVKVFEASHIDSRKYDFFQETVAITSDYQRAKYILEYNVGGIDDGIYKYALLITVKDGKVYGEINPLNIEVYKYNIELNTFEICNEKDIIEGINNLYCYIK